MIGMIIKILKKQLVKRFKKFFFVFLNYFNFQGNNEQKSKFISYMN